MTTETPVRLTSDQRRESILEAATVVFGERGYHGATTDAIASAAGISQAYVVRMFGSKEELFIAAAAAPSNVSSRGFAPRSRPSRPRRRCRPGSTRSRPRIRTWSPTAGSC